MERKISSSSGALLRRYRLDAELTQEVLAERAGISARSIQSLERGESRPHRDTARRLAAALGLQGDELSRFMATATPIPRRRTSLTATTAAASPRTVPMSPTPLLGRERDVAMALHLFNESTGGRLVTLTGPGGVGKTRLAVQVAGHRHAAWADGAVFVDLAPLREPELLPAALAQALGIGDAGDQPVLETVRQSLAARRMLLVLDNFEQVLASAPVVADLLATCPYLTCLVTSREPLHLRWEHEQPVLPLALPAMGNQDLQGIAASPAVALFVQRARAVMPTFVLTAHSAAVVAEICFRLDGLPLAIELAAARSKLLTPQAIQARLGHRLGLLAGETPDAPLRHQTLRAALDWSYDLLKPADRALFRCLAVFVGGFTVEAASAVCAGITDVTLDRLGALVDKSLILIGALADTRAESSEPRFRLLETIREYGLELLENSGELDATLERHARYLVTLAEQAEPRIVESGQTYWLNLIEDEHDNLRAALTWSAREPARVELGLRLLTSLISFWYIRSNFGESRTWLERLLAQAEHAQVSPALRVKALWSAGSLASYQGDYAGAGSLIEAAMAIDRADQDDATTTVLLTWRGLVAFGQFDDAKAQRCFEEARKLGRRLGDIRLFAFALSHLSRLAYRQSDYARARRLGQASLRLFRARDEPWGVALLLTVLGAVAHRTGKYELARSLHEQSLDLSREVGDRANVAQALTNLGNLERALGDLVGARGRYEESLRLCREIGDRRGASLALGNLGAVIERQGDRAGARRLYEESLTIVRAVGNQRALPAVLGRLANLARVEGDVDAARIGYLECLRLWQRVGDHRAVMCCLVECANLVAAAQPESALRLYTAADMLLRQLGSSLPPPEREDVDRAMTVLHRVLGEGTAAAAIAAGREMALPDAVRLAVTCLEPVRPIDEQNDRALTANGVAPLSPREREVAVLIAGGRTNREIAAELVISERTADTHVAHILNKLGVAARAQVATWAVRQGIVPLPVSDHRRDT